MGSNWGFLRVVGLVALVCVLWEPHMSTWSETVTDSLSDILHTQHWYYVIFGNAILTFLPSYSAAFLQRLQSSDLRQAVGFSPPFTLDFLCVWCIEALSSFAETSWTAADTKRSHPLASFHSNFSIFFPHRDAQKSPGWMASSPSGCFYSR